MPYPSLAPRGARAPLLVFAAALAAGAILFFRLHGAAAPERVVVPLPHAASRPGPSKHAVAHPGSPEAPDRAIATP